MAKSDPVVVFDKKFFQKLRNLFETVGKAFANNTPMVWLVFVLIAAFIILQQFVLWFFIKIPLN